MRLFCAFAVVAATLLVLGGDVAAGSGRPTNGAILFQTTRPPGDQSAGTIWRVEGDGSGLDGPVTPGSTPGCSSCFNSSQPAFSPDGTKVAFSTGLFALNGVGPAIAVMNPDGTDIRFVVGHSDSHNCFENGQPTWSPDGTKIAFSTCEGGADPTLEVVNVDGSDLHVVAHFSSPDGARYNHPSWSPDGTKIAYARPTDNGEEDIFTIRPDGTGETNLGVSGFGPAWSPDGTKLLFYRNTIPESGIWVMNADGSDPARLSSSGDVHPAWSPDGTKIVFASNRDRDGFQLWTMDADGANQTRITDLDHGDTWPTWGPAPSNDVVITDCNDPRASQLTSVAGNLTINIAGCHLDLGQLTSVGGDLDLSETDSATANLSNVVNVGGNLTFDGTGTTAVNAVNLGNVVNVGANLTLTGAGSTTINLGTVVNVGGNLTFDGAGSTAVNLGSLGGVAGNVSITESDDANLTLAAGDTTVAGDVSVDEGGNVSKSSILTGGNESLLSRAGDLLSARTATGSTDVQMLGGIAALHAVIPSGAFTDRIPFTIERSGDEAPSAGKSADGSAATIDPIAGYRFSFAVPTLNADAALTLTVDTARLDDATRSAFLAALDRAAIVVKGDAPGSVYQAFARCSSGQTPAADHCAAVTVHGNLVQFDGVAGHFSEYAVALVTPTDSTPPVIAPTVSGTLGGGGFYTSDVTIGWNVQDAESAIQSQSGCGTTTVTADTTGTTFTCSATSGGGTATRSVTIARDATAPSVAYTGNAGTYAVDATVAIACAASDPSPGSGLASSTCAGANGPAYSFGPGSHTLSAVATDVAGNSVTGSTTFTVSVATGGLCRLTYAFVAGSDAYRRLPPVFRSLVDGSVTSVCRTLDQIVPRLTQAQKTQLVAAYKRGLQGLVLLGYLTPAQAATLGRLADAL